MRKDYYTVSQGGAKSDIVERSVYGPIDDFLGRLLPQVAANVQAGVISNFDPEALASLQDVVLRMAKRTPDFMQGIDDAEIGREFIGRILEDPLRELTVNERAHYESALQDEKHLKFVGRDVQVRATLNTSDRVAQAMSEYVPRWGIIRSNHSLILSSRMVYRIGNGSSNGLMNKRMEMWMPITPKICLVMLRDPRNEVPHINELKPTKVREANLYAAKNSHEIASHSRKLLLSLIAPR